MTLRSPTRALRTLLGVAVVTAGLCAATSAFEVPPVWTQPTAPFHVVGPIWYVGSQGLAAYLIKTRDGALLVDGTMAENVPRILRNIASIGVRPRDVRMLLVTHAHFDHVAGDAEVVHATGAKVVAGAGDVRALETGVAPGEVDYDPIGFAPVHVSRAMRDGDVLHFGGVTLHAVATPGHTPGCTSWTMRAVDRGRPLDVVFACSMTTGRNILVGNRRYPGIVDDYRRSFARIATLPADVVLPSHPDIAGVMAHRDDGRWVQPGLLKRIADSAARDFEVEFARQRKALRPLNGCEAAGPNWIGDCKRRSDEKGAM